ncbi:MAG: LPS-assembly protein LptD [Burkholderiales bacterium]|nr:LPS-assembly protein LptD [Burkholderiales bacterium]
MHRLFIGLLISVAWLVFVQPAAAQSTGLQPFGGGMGLKLEPELLPPVPEDLEEDLPLFLDAERIEGIQGQYLEAIGDVVVRRRGQQLQSDRLSYSFTDNAVTASGNVRFRRLGDVLTGDYAYYDLDDDSGLVNNPTYHFTRLPGVSASPLPVPGSGRSRVASTAPPSNARGKAERVILRDRDRYRAERATYTNCDVGDDDWYLGVGRLDLDRLQDVGVARNATVYFKGVPILYSPWINFPLSSRRKTGFLPPAIGTTNNSGFEVTVPFYWNIAPNRDLTLSPRLLSRRGLLLGSEFRYLAGAYNGELRADFLPDDQEKNDNRWALAFRHAQRFTPRLTGSINVQRVSDDTYFVDLANRVAATSQTNLPQEASLRYNGDWWTLLGRFQRFQTLQDPLSPTTPPYYRVPQLVLNAAQQNVRGFDLRFYGELVNFSHRDLTSAVRQIYYPSAEYRFGGSFFYATPKVGLHYTAYNYKDGERSGDSRLLPIVSLDTGMNFSRQVEVFGRGLVQTLEPRLYYVYIPFRRQDQLPLFDTAIADFNLAQIFTENRFNGWDRINDANQVTAAVTTRFLDARSGREWLRAIIGQRYFLKEQEIRLSESDVRNSDRSDLLAGVSGSITRALWADLGMQYNLDEGESTRFNAALRYRPQPGKVVNAAYRYTRDVLEQVDLSAQWPLTRRWTALARWNYSLDDKTLVEALGGLEYNAGCWTTRFVVHDFVTSTNERSRAFFLQLELSGLSSIGTSPMQVLGQSILGYGRSADRATTHDPYYPGMPDE